MRRVVYNAFLDHLKETVKSNEKPSVKNGRLTIKLSYWFVFAQCTDETATKIWTKAQNDPKFQIMKAAFTAKFGDEEAKEYFNFQLLCYVG